MNIREACASIMGDTMARNIIHNMGIHWAVTCAMAEARTSDDPDALDAINAFNAKRKAAAQEVE